VALDDLFKNADIISLHCPSPGDGSPLIDRRVIAIMKKGVYIINTARGSLLDNEAIIEALDAGKIAGLTLDAFESEPPEDWRLVKHDKVIATPHVGGFTQESLDRTMSVVVDNLIQALNAHN
jgi:D-3-phosphoglycerate dehydrogenase